MLADLPFSPQSGCSANLQVFKPLTLYDSVGAAIGHGRVQMARQHRDPFQQAAFPLLITALALFACASVPAACFTPSGSPGHPEGLEPLYLFDEDAARERDRLFTMGKLLLWLGG
ncbi:g5094 [Coccomyxa elongata]